MNPKNIIYLFALFALLNACHSSSREKRHIPETSKVELLNVDGKYRLFVNKEVFYVKGAGCHCTNTEKLAMHGANSFRTWSDGDDDSGIKMLDNAHQDGLMVLMGLNIAKERHGFDYNDSIAVQKQFQNIKKIVVKYKDHPALLGWGIGNELNLKATNLKVWDAVSDISTMIHEIDGRHPTTTMLAGIPKRDLNYLKSIHSDLDFISIQLYGDIENLSQRMLESDFKGPYMVTEWGVTGHWESPQTEWGAAIEQSSTEKASSIIDRYQNVILADDTNCLGSYIFLWGQKQERTPTWYGHFSENGEELETIGALHYLWTGEWMEQKAPSITSASLHGKSRFDNITLSAGQEYESQITTSYSNKNSLKLRIEILKESNDHKTGGDWESRPERVHAAIYDYKEGVFSITAPEEEGPYRLYIYLINEAKQAATINIPFFVH